MAMTLNSEDIQSVARTLYCAKAVYHVAKTGNDSNDGLSWETAYLTLTKLATVMATGDVALVGPGTWSEGVIDFTGIVSRFRGSGRNATTLEGLNLGFCEIEDLTFTEQSLVYASGTPGSVTLRRVNYYDSNNYPFYVLASETAEDYGRITFLAEECNFFNGLWLEDSDAVILNRISCGWGYWSIYCCLGGSVHGVAQIDNLSILGSRTTGGYSGVAFTRGKIIGKEWNFKLLADNVTGGVVLGVALQSATDLQVENIQIITPSLTGCKDISIASGCTLNLEGSVTYDSSKVTNNGTFTTRLSRLPNVNLNASGGLMTYGTGTGQINPSSGKVPATVAAGDGVDAAAAKTAAEAAQTQIGTAGAGLTALGDSRIANLDATVGTRLATSAYTTPPTVSQITTALNTYFATIVYNRDSANAVDEYSIQWFKNGLPATTAAVGAITSPLITVYSRNGNALISAAAMTAVGSGTGAYKYNASTDKRASSSDAVLISVSAIIEGSTRTFTEWKV